MNWLLGGGPWSPIGWDVGFIQADLATVRDTLTGWRRGLGAQLVINDTLRPYPQCLHSLEPLQAPWTRELLIAHGPHWTAYLNNDRNGGDPASAGSVVAGRLGVRYVIAIHQPLTTVGHASTQFQLLGPEGEPPLGYIRTLAAQAEDGHWSWEASGTPQPFEDTPRYQACRIRDRLTRAMLVDYLAAVGIDVDNDAQYGNAILVTQRVSWSSVTETLPEARARWQLD